MKNVAVRLIAGGLVAALSAAPALASDPQSNSILNAEAAPLSENVVLAAMLGTWINAAAVPVGTVRYAHAQCLGENVFYVITGVGGGNNTFRYNAVANSWATLAPIPVGGQGPRGVCYQGKIYVLGGDGGSGANGTNLLFIYDIATNTWSAGASSPRAHTMAHVGAHNGRIYLIGGDNNFQPADGVSNEVNVYDIATNTWLANGAPMPTGVVAGGYAQLGSFVYIAGGWIVASPGSNSSVTQRFDMATNTWTTGPAFPSARADLAMSATNTALYSQGGDGNGGGFFEFQNTVQRLDITGWPAGTWTATDNLPSGLQAHTGGFCTNAFFPASGEVWNTGGFNGTFTTLNLYLAAESCPSAASVAPVGLEVDPAPAGNRVLEPNEPSVIVAPSWRNTGTSAIASLTGVLSNFTGPAGATYTINDSTANYGAVAAGATATCTGANCYAVTVTAATRPVAHWDSMATETVTPPGTVKDWVLHIGDTFTDVPRTNGFYRFIETIVHKNVTGGCTATTYCPTADTTREQMAVFVLVSKEPAGYVPPPCGATPRFTDVPVTSGFCRWIEELARRGVVSGCTATTYCPTAPATREQMAVFVLRTLDPTLNPPACVAGSEVFGDVPASSGFCRWIEELFRRGVVTGCGGGNYCPAAPVTREQMSVFLAVTFGLQLYGV